jgi:hypothetical protein
MTRRTFLRVLVLAGSGVSQLFFTGCAPGDPTDEFFALAANSLGPVAHQGRAMVVNPLLLTSENPRMSEAALQSLRDQGYEVMGPDGIEDPERATLYFTPPRAIEDGRFTLNVYVSLGARPGRMRRGDTWWRVVVGCEEACSVAEIAPTAPPS